MAKSARCAAFKSLRRKCQPDCVLAPYFPSTNPERFSSVHKVFGASNITRILMNLQQHLRFEAADCLYFEAYLRVKDPVYGCVGIISQLQQQIMQTQNDIITINGEIAFYNAQRQHQLQQMPSANDQCDPISIEQQWPFDKSTSGFFHT